MRNIFKPTKKTSVFDPIKNPDRSLNPEELKKMASETLEKYGNPNISEENLIRLCSNNEDIDWNKIVKNPTISEENLKKFWSNNEDIDWNKIFL